MKKDGFAVLSLIATAICIVVLAALLPAAPALVRLYVSFRVMQEPLYTIILVTFYICSVPAMAALFLMIKLLRNIRRGIVFALPNVRLIGGISWCCCAVSLTELVAGFRYPPFLFVFCAMFFLFLVLRVVRNCFISATALKEENSLTI